MFGTYVTMCNVGFQIQVSKLIVVMVAFSELFYHWLLMVLECFRFVHEMYFVLLVTVSAVWWWCNTLLLLCSTYRRCSSLVFCNNNHFELVCCPSVRQCIFDRVLILFSFKP